MSGSFQPSASFSALISSAVARARHHGAGAAVTGVHQQERDEHRGEHGAAARASRRAT